MHKSLENKIALVTGGTTGIGRATAVAFARAGAKVVVSGRRETEGEETVRLIKKTGGDGLFVQADVSRETDVRALVEKTVAAFGRLDAAFNNAGVEGALFVSTHEQTETNYRQVTDVNVLGVLLSMKHEIAAMLKNGGAIVNNASVGGMIGFPGMSVYVASKHAVIGLTRSAALEYAKQNIRVNAVSPGGVETPMFDRFGLPAEMIQAIKEEITRKSPIKRFGTPEELAKVALFLASDDSSYVVGDEIVVDGGMSLL